MRFPFLLEDIGFNNDAEIYSKNIIKPFFSGKYNVQMPGYISYIYLGRMFYLFIKDTVVIQHIINIFLLFFISFSFFYLLKRLKFSDLESFVFSLIFSFNNILMLGSITGGNRLFLTLASIVLIYFAFRIINEEERYLIIIFSILFAFFAGFRQDISFYFFPLFIYLFFKVKDIRLITISLILFILICLAWFIPLMMEYRGISGYLETMKNADAVRETSIFFSSSLTSPLINIARIFIYLINAFLFVFPFFIYSLIKKEFKIKLNILIILILSFFPSLIFQMLVHNGNFVQLAAFMTPLFIFLIYSFKIDNVKKIVFSFLVIFLVLFQFFGLKMFQEDTFLKKTANVLWLQYTYDGAKKVKTYRLKNLIENDKKKEKKKKQENNNLDQGSNKNFPLKLN
ncbi:MAG: hypothetical protein JXB50_00100 [Spirochaetes bacterium]|nr:hypothetical protein [Spirochaetota bacterium]